MSNSITRTYSFANGGVADGGQVDSEIQNIVNTINNADAGTTTWTAVKATTLTAVTTFNAVTGTFTGAVTINPVGSQLVLGGVSGGKTMTINAAAPSANRVLTMGDPGGNDSFVYASAAQGINSKIIGTTTNDAGGAGYVGETISASVVASAATALTSGVALTIASISLTAGDWDVRVMGAYKATNAGTSITESLTAISLTNNTMPAADARCVPTAAGEVWMDQNNLAQSPGNGGTLSGVTLISRVSLASTTTIYFVEQLQFTVSTAAGFGSIVARRVR